MFSKAIREKMGLGAHSSDGWMTCMCGCSCVVVWVLRSYTSLTWHMCIRWAVAFKTSSQERALIYNVNLSNSSGEDDSKQFFKHYLHTSADSEQHVTPPVPTLSVSFGLQVLALSIGDERHFHHLLAKKCTISLFELVCWELLPMALTTGRDSNSWFPWTV